MKIATWVCIGLLAAAGCKKKDDPKKQEPATTKPEAKPDAKPAEPPAAAGEMTGEEMAAQYATCWGHFNDRKWDDFTACFTPDAESQDVDAPKHTGVEHIVDTAKAFATAFPDSKADIQLTLVSDVHVVGVVLFTGTHEGPLATQGGKPVEATHKKVGFLIGHVIDFDRKTRKATGQYTFADPSALMGQLGILQMPHRAAMSGSLPEKGTVVVSSGSDTEKANEAALLAATEAFNKHDAATYEATRTPDMTFYDSATPDDVNHAQWMAGVQNLWKEFSDLESNLGGAFAAGDYTVSFGEMTGTNDGDFSPTVKATGKPIKAVFLNIAHYKDGKLDKAWRFVNGLTMPMQLGMIK